jgi:alpha-tubulin suppressor-like RCC1 family protein
MLRGLSTRSAVVATAEHDLHVTGEAPVFLPQLPTELLLQVLRHLDVRDLARLAFTCRQLYCDPPCPPRSTSVVEEELRRRVADAERWLPSSLPAGVTGWVPALLKREWRDSLETGTVAAGDSPHSVLVDVKGALMVCGFEDEQRDGTLGLPSTQGDNEDDDPGTVLVSTPVPSMAGIRIRQVVAGSNCSLALTEAGLVYMWGKDGFERIASDTEDRLVPTLIRELSQHRVRRVSVRSGICAAVTEEGLLFTWTTAFRQEKFDEEAEAQQRRPWFGLGREGASIGYLWRPHCVTALQGERVGSVAVGTDFTLVSTEAEAVFSFGDHEYGSLGHRITKVSSCPSAWRR